MNKEDFRKEYYGVTTETQKCLCNMFRDKISGLTWVSNVDKFNKLCHNIYFENMCGLQKYPFSFTIYAAGSLIGRIDSMEKDVYNNLMREIGIMYSKQYERDVVAYSKFKFREKFKNANEKRWWNIW